VTDRRAELAANLADVEARIGSACVAAGRQRGDITLVAVTKTWPVSDAELLHELGLTDLGENRDQEAAQKAAAVDGVTWHFVGSVQTNKARSVASYAHVVQSVDRSSLVQALAEGAERAGRELDVLLQISLDGNTSRGGAAPGAVRALGEQVAVTPSLHLRGVMAVAPLGVEPALAFATLAEVAADLRAEHPSADVISAGMSGDLESAISAGATYVRIGTALLGPRKPPLR
jgi:pyridoxal phosphate enzyme (YggS family)